MVLMLSCQLHALIMLDIASQLLEGHHGVAEEPVLSTCLLRLVVYELVGKFIFDLFPSVLLLLMVSSCCLLDVLMKLVHAMFRCKMSGFKLRRSVFCWMSCNSELLCKFLSLM